MRRINTTNKATDLFGAGKHGWKSGVPGTADRPTEGQAEWFNAVQEEISSFIEAAGLDLDPDDSTQLLAAVGLKFLNRTDLALATGAALMGWKQLGTGAVDRHVDKKLQEIELNGGDFGVDYSGGSDSTDAFNIALAAAAAMTAGGKGATLKLSAGVVVLSDSITVPDRVKIVGAGSRSTIINNSKDGPSFIFDGITLAGLSGVRLGLNNNAAAMGIQLVTTSADVRWCRFEDVEIASVGLVSGQVGLSAVVSGGHIITESVFKGFVFFQVDQPVIWNGPEGNFFEATLSGFGAVARTAFAGVGHANIIAIRVAGNPAAGSVAYGEGGSRNIVSLIADIGSTSEALNVPGAGNNIRLSRPETLTPVGNYATGNTVSDSEFLAVRRVATGGTLPTSAQFSLGAGWGSTATVTAVIGKDQRVKFTINSSGTGQAAFPTVGYAFLDGKWPNASPVPQVTRDGGNQATVGGFGSSANVDGWGFQFAGMPVAGESYVFVVTVG